MKVSVWVCSTHGEVAFEDQRSDLPLHRVAYKCWKPLQLVTRNAKPGEEAWT